MFAAARPRTIARPSVRAAASARRASRAAARVHARANDGDVNVDRREFVRNAAFAALSATLVAPREVRARAMRASDDARATRARGRRERGRARGRDGGDALSGRFGARDGDARRRGDAATRAREGGDE